jgi:hypothetical protein
VPDSAALIVLGIDASGGASGPAFIEIQEEGSFTAAGDLPKSYFSQAKTKRWSDHRVFY